MEPVHYGRRMISFEQAFIEEFSRFVDEIHILRLATESIARSQPEESDVAILLDNMKGIRDVLGDVSTAIEWVSNSIDKLSDDGDVVVSDFIQENNNDR